VQFSAYWSLDGPVDARRGATYNVNSGYPDEVTATAATEEAQRLAKDLIMEPDAIAVINRDSEGKFHVTTNHHAVGGGATWGMF
jgi:uncharacterized membrane protein